MDDVGVVHDYVGWVEVVEHVFDGGFVDYGGYEGFDVWGSDVWWFHVEHVYLVVGGVGRAGDRCVEFLGCFCD